MDICNLGLSDFKNQYNFLQDYEKCKIERARNELQKYFEKIDQEIFDAPWRKNKGYIPDGFKSRTLITIYGAITFKRRVYRYWDNVKNKYKSVFN